MKKSAVGSSLLTGNKRKVVSESEAIQKALKKAGPQSSQQHAEIIKEVANNYRVSQKKTVDKEVIVEKAISIDEDYFKEQNFLDDDELLTYTNEDNADDPDILDFQQQNPAGEQTLEEIKELSVPRPGYKNVSMTVWSAKENCWTVKPVRQRFPVQRSATFKLSQEDIDEYRKMYCNKNEEYRTVATEIFPIEAYVGVFTFCGCARITCKINVTASSHYCCYCLRPMVAFCLTSPGEWGCCRTCFLAKHGNTNQIEVSVVPRRKTILNASPRPSTIVLSTPIQEQVSYVFIITMSHVTMSHENKSILATILTYRRALLPIIQKVLILKWTKMLT